MGGTRVVVTMTIAALLGCGGSATGATGQAASGALFTALAVARSAQRRSEGRCYTPCTHATHCDEESGLCVPGEDESEGLDPDLAGVDPEAPLAMRLPATRAATQPATQTGAAGSATADDGGLGAFSCTIAEGERQTVQAHSAAGAREVCLGFNDVGADPEACTCERVARRSPR